MKNRRLTSLILLTVASVFLFFCLSCGIPTYIVPKVTFTKDSSGDNNVSFKVAYSCDDVVGDGGRVGLILLYNITSTEAKDGNSNIPKQFKNLFVPTSYNGVDVDVEQNTPVISIAATSTSGEIRAYAFTCNGSLVSDPLYTLSLPVNGDFSKKLSMEYVPAEEGNGVINLSVDGVPALLLGLDPSSVIDNYIEVYAAVSVKSTSFTNHYWSDLKFVGSMRIVDDGN